MKQITGSIVIILIALSILCAGCTDPSTPEKGQQAGYITPVATREPVTPAHEVNTTDINPVNGDDMIMVSLLDRIGARVNRSLDTLDRNISGAAGNLAGTGISGGAANSILGDIAASPAVVDAVTVTSDGKIAAVMPAGYQHIIGEEVRNQSHIIKGLSTGNPVLSDEFQTVEGFSSSAIVYPVRSADGTVIGLISVPFLPESLLSSAISPLVDNSMYEVTVIQMDGRVIYATNTSQVGMNSVNDPLIISRPDLNMFINQVLSADSGQGTYSVQDVVTNTTGTVENYWTTVSLHGTRWRIILDKIQV
jgi:hypothetical protein